MQKTEITRRNDLCASDFVIIVQIEFSGLEPLFEILLSCVDAEMKSGHQAVIFYFPVGVKITLMA